MKKSKTQQALQLVSEGLTPYAAAQRAGIATSTVYTALKRQQGKPVCPCCGQVVRKGFAVDPSVVRKGRTV